MHVMEGVVIGPERLQRLGWGVQREESSSCGLDFECAVRWWRRLGGGMSEPVIVSGTFPLAPPGALVTKGLLC